MIHDGQPYDSKAIVGVAHGFLPGERPLTAADFSDGEDTVARLLRRLGFTIIQSMLAEATIDEIVGRVENLKVNRASWRPALYQPITLLWAIGRARGGVARSLGGKKRSKRFASCSNVMARTASGPGLTIRLRRCTMQAYGSCTAMLG